MIQNSWGINLSSIDSVGWLTHDKPISLDHLQCSSPSFTGFDWIAHHAKLVLMNVRIILAFQGVLLHRLVTKPGLKTNQGPSDGALEKITLLRVIPTMTCQGVFGHIF